MADVGKVIGVVVEHKDLVGKLIGLIAGLFKHGDKPKTHVEAPTPSPAPQEEDFPDDVIPVPAGQRKVDTVRVRLSRVQLPKSRFPEEYTKENPFGLVRPGPIADGSSAMNWGSKFWLDITAYDQEGKEFLPEAVMAYGLAYKTEFRIENEAGAVVIAVKGVGADAAGNPVAGYVMEGSEEIGNGATAWISTNGFLHQMKTWPASDGHTYTATAAVDGVGSKNRVTFKVS